VSPTHARARLRIQPLTEEERQRILDAMSEQTGNDTNIVAEIEDDTDSVQRSSLRTLRPGEWVIDEVIHYFLDTLQKRDE
jgi:Ulp1 family protease